MPDIYHGLETFCHRLQRRKHHTVPLLGMAVYSRARANRTAKYRSKQRGKPTILISIRRILEFLFRKSEFASVTKEKKITPSTFEHTVTTRKTRSFSRLKGYAIVLHAASPRLKCPSLQSVINALLSTELFYLLSQSALKTVATTEKL